METHAPSPNSKGKGMDRGYLIRRIFLECGECCQNSNHECQEQYKYVDGRIPI